MTEEARLVESEYGLVAETEGWFVVNVHDAAWMTNEHFGSACIFEGGPVDFPHAGFTLGILQPGQTGGLYHREAGQEDFLVLAGECLLLVEGEERRLRAWDFVHCPPNTEHGFVATGTAPCVIFMTGSRLDWPKKGIVYPRSELALRHGNGVETETAEPREAYAAFPRWQPGADDFQRRLPSYDRPPTRGAEMGYPVVHFEVVGKDGEKLRSYYGELFGWQIDANNPLSYGMVPRDSNQARDGSPGIGGGVGQAPDDYEGHVTFYVAVPDVEESLQKAEQLGGTRMTGPERVMDMVEIGLFTDPEGHVIGLVKDEPMPAQEPGA